MQVSRGCDDIVGSSKAKCQGSDRLPPVEASLRTRCGATTPHLVRLSSGQPAHHLA